MSFFRKGRNRNIFAKPRPERRCKNKNCRAPHGGAYGAYCYWCHLKRQSKRKY